MRLPDETWMCHTFVYQVDDGKDMGTHLPPEHRNSQLGRTKNSRLSQISLCIAREILTLAWILHRAQIVASCSPRDHPSLHRPQQGPHRPPHHCTDCAHCSAGRWPSGGSVLEAHLYPPEEPGRVSRSSCRYTVNGRRPLVLTHRVPCVVAGTSRPLSFISLLPRWQ